MRRIVSPELLAAGLLFAISAHGDGPFVASTNKGFVELMQEAMQRMHEGMRAAPQNGIADHDFTTQMIPHHQGAIDMAEALLVYGKDPELRQLAKGIIAEQQNEIQVMRLWLSRHGGAPPAKGNDR